MTKRMIRVLLTKAGLDSHDRGMRVVAAAIRDAGMEVIYGGVFQTEESIYRMAVDEDVDVVGLSFLCGGHVEWVERVIGLFLDRGADLPAFLVGGIIPHDDMLKLKNLGVKEVFGPGTDLNEIIETIKRITL
jgi:methylmalonyl-CoA mutase C-terminal domain/subunit